MTDWIEWKGGECPVDAESLVDIKFPGKAATIIRGWPAGPVDWSHKFFYRIHAHDRSPSPVDGLVEALREIERGGFNCATHQYFMAAQERARQALAEYEASK